MHLETNPDAPRHPMHYDLGDVVRPNWPPDVSEQQEIILCGHRMREPSGLRLGTEPRYRSVPDVAHFYWGLDSAQNNLSPN